MRSMEIEEVYDMRTSPTQSWPSITVLIEIAPHRCGLGKFNLNLLPRYNTTDRLPLHDVHNNLLRAPVNRGKRSWNGLTGS